MELEHAMESEYVKSHTLCIMRTLNAVTSHLGDAAAADYLDVVGSNKTRTLDATAAKRIEILREEAILRRVRPCCFPIFPMKTFYVFVHSGSPLVKRVYVCVCACFSGHSNG